jgi:hypothetical protein
VGDLAEGHAARPTLALNTLLVGSVGDVLGDESRGLDVRASFVVGAGREAPATLAPFARVGITFKPGGTDAALDLLAVQPPERLVEGLAEVLTDDDRGLRIRCDLTTLHPWVADG